MPFNQREADENQPLKSDEDAQFEQESEITAQHPQESDAPPKQSILEGTLPNKEDTLGNSDFPPLSEKDKQPKLQDEDRIRELNHKSSMDD